MISLNNKNLEILTTSGFKNFKGIQKVLKPILRISFDNGKTITCSTSHRFISGDLEIFASSLYPGASLLDASDELVTVTKVEELNSPQELFDILGSETSSYISEGFNHHNCEFLGSTYTVIDPDVLKVLYNDAQESIPIKVDMNGKLKLYELPDKKFRYILGLDPSKGSGKHDSTIQVLKITSFKPTIKAKQVAVFADNSTDPYAVAQIANRVSIYFNNALIFCEGNGEGAATVSHLW